MKQLSFILPCYNVERYITDCLNSIYSQNLSEDDFEVICVNDCSTDGTHDAIAAIQAEHKNLVLLDQPRNMYSGAARNRGLEIAKGKYIWFVDSDDKVKPDVANMLLEMAKTDDLDLLLFNYDEFSESNPQVFKNIDNLFRGTEVMTGCEFVERQFRGKLAKLSLLWLRLFRRSLIEENAIRFSDLYISQDCPFAWETLLRAKRVKSIADRCYEYRSNAKSITANKNTAKKAAVWSFQFPIQLLDLKEKMEGQIPKRIADGLEDDIKYEVNEFAVRYLCLPETEKTVYYKAMRSERKWYGRIWTYLSRKNRMVYFVGKVGENSFKRIIGVMSK